MGWPLALQPPYWPGIPLPPPMVYSDPGAALLSPGANPFPGSPATLAPSCQEPSAFTVQPTKPVLASQATAAAKHEVPAQPLQRGAQPSGRASDPRRQSRPVGESPAPQPVGQPPIATARTVGESAAAWPVGQPPAPWPVGQPPIATARTVGESTTAWPVGQPPAPPPVGQPPAQPTRDPPAPWPVGKSSAAQHPIVTAQPMEESVPAAAPWPVGESTTAQPVGEPPAQSTRQPPAPRPVGEPPAQSTRQPPAPRPVGEPPAPRPVGEPPAQSTRQPPAPRPVGEPPAQSTRQPPAPRPVGEPPAPRPVGEPPAQSTREPPAPRPVGEPPAPRPVGEPPAQSTREPPAPWPVGEPPAPRPVGEPPAQSTRQPPSPRPMGEPPAQSPREPPAPRPMGEPPAQSTREPPAPWPVGEPPDTCPKAAAAAPAKVSVPSLLEGAQPDPKGAVLQEPRPPGHTSIPGKAGALLRAREESQPTKPAPARPWRHRPLIGPAQPGASKDIVQAFISEIGIEASDLSSLLEQFEKTEATKEELHVRCPRDRLVLRNAGSESHQDKNPPDSLHAPELANVAGLTPPATPPHQLWKPLAAVSLLGKPGAAPQEGSQRTAKFMEAKPLPQSKPRGKGQLPTTCGPPPRHVGSGDHDYCVRGPGQPEEGSRLPSTPAPSELGSRWNVKHHQDITIKLPSSLPTRTLAWPRLSPKPGTAPGSSEQLDHRTSAQTQIVADRSSPRPSVLLSPDTSPCRDEEPRTRDPQLKQLAAKRSLRCYRRRGASPSPRARASRSFSSTSSGASASSSSSSSSSSSRSRSRSLSPPPKRWRRYHSRRSRSSHSSSRSSCGSCGRSRGRSSSSSSYSSRSSSASHSRSPSPRRRSNRRRRYDYCDPPDRLQHQKVLHKERAIEERRVVFIGKIPSRMTRAELRHRFSVFGDIEECTLHFRAEGDNYGFVTYRYAKEAFAAIESGHKLRRPDEQPFDLCFGGRRQFCRRNYADLDSNREDFDPAPIKSKFDSLDFDTLLKQAQRKLRR
uniref:Peroxisome proliferator-activated receptor gamma coactivator-related protein 1 n=1 Tax=Gopherus evgoodei TaxID=1825980 RepID=A0A8C4XYD4_9SAUR